MRVPVSWLRDLVSLPDAADPATIADRLTFLGLKLEELEVTGRDVSGPLVVGRVLQLAPETHSNGKTIRWCQVDVGEEQPRGIVCGAANFAVGDLVVVALPGAVLPGDFAIAARKTYGHVSDGMICSARELGLGDDHTGILVLPPDSAAPGDDADGVLGLRDAVIELEINPDRAYALAMRGVARDAAIGFDAAYADPVDSLPAATPGAGWQVRVEDESACDGFVALGVSGIDPSAPTPRWLARRLQLAGMRPISLVVDVTNYVMLELGNPIHGYDRSALRGPIVVRRAAPGERLTTLDDVDRALDPEDIVIADDRGAIGLAGVMGGADTEISSTTTDVLIEAAHFDPVSIARTARRHRLPSEASRRFERGVDPTIARTAAQRVADLLVELGGGVVDASATVVATWGPRSAVTVPYGLSSAVAGFDIPTEDVERSLVLVGCAVVRAVDGPPAFTVTPPQWRHDLTDPNDFVEEVLRVVGYELVPSLLPPGRPGAGLTREQRQRRSVSVALAAAGFVEAPAAPFMARGDADALGLEPDDARRRAITVRNPMSDELPLLRTTLMPGLLRTLSRNVARGQEDVAVFELASVTLPGPGAPPAAPLLGVDRRPTTDELKELEATLPAQPWHVAAVRCGNRAAAGWRGLAEPATWAEAISAAQAACRAVGAEARAVAAHRAPWHPGRCAELLIGETGVGHAGELHPAVCIAMGVPARTVAFELDLDAVLAHAIGRPPAPRLSAYPVGKEDVAVVVAASVPAADVEAALREGAGELLESLRLFDVYTGSQLDAGQKSLAFALRFRAPDRTLTEAEIAAARDAAVAEAGRRVGAVLRS